MSRPLSLALHTLYADLLGQGGEDLFDPDLPENGSLLVRLARAGVSAHYVYYQGYRPAVGDFGRGQRYALYLGRSDDPVVEARIARFQRVKAVRSERATTVRALTGAGMPRPDRIAGRIIEALARAGLFPDDAVLIGDVAYQTYAGVLGVWPSKPRKAPPGDHPAVAIVVRDRGRLTGILDALRSVDPSFAAVTSSPTIYQSRNGIQVSVSIAVAEPTDLMSFETAAPIQALVLHGPCIPVAVPAPERYVVGSLISEVSGRIRSIPQAAHDGDPAAALGLVEALLVAGRREALARAFRDAARTDPQWDTLLNCAMRALRW